MRTSLASLAKWLVSVFFLVSLAALPLAAQVNMAAPRITQAINNADRVALRGNVYPLARPQFDRGIAPASLPMERMTLLLKRSPQQEAALDALLAQQQDKSSPNYHHWLTPAQFGAQFGPSDQDIQTIENWLESQGFSVDSVSKGRTMIEFSGNAGEVQSAFHTQIHSYVLPTGAQHWANSTNPEIPAALAPVVAGIHGLNSFFPKPLSHIVREIRGAPSASQAKPQPEYTFSASGACSFPQQLNEAPAGDICFLVMPSDFATIYNVAPLWSAGYDGTGESIAIANDSNINVTDVSTFRSLTGLSAKIPNVIFATGTDPGINSDEGEAVLDAEWSGAVAKNATIDLVIAPTTNVSFGGNVAAQYIIDNNLAPILSFSFGGCEAGTGNLYNSMWQQAAAEGITVLVASGDDGSAACDNSSANATSAQPAQYGLQVNGLASTPYDVAVGGTDFDDITNPGTYWNLNDSSSASTPSAKGYVAETAWNESCTNAIFSTSPLNVNFGNATTPEAACNNATLASGGLVVPNGGSGGASALYAKPSWQTSLTPSDGARDLPDVSLFAGTGLISASAYFICQSDQVTCGLGPGSSILGAGGTSVSAQVMAGIVALIDQKAGGPQGNINPVLYSLAGQASNVCPTSSPTGTCIFYDVTTGTNSMPCATNSQDCYTAKTGDNIGILADSNHNPAYDAATGYDLATGLGSINAANLADASGAWAAPSSAPDFSITSSNPNPTVTLGSNNQGTMSITVTPQNGFTGNLYLSCPGLPAGDTCSFNPASPVTISGSTTVTVTVSGTIASVPGHINVPAGPASWPTGTEITFVFACLAALLFFGLRLRHRRWNFGLALVAFTLFAIAGCSSGGSSGNSGGGGPSGSPFQIAVTATTCTNGAGCVPGTTHSLVFTVQ